MSTLLALLLLFILRSNVRRDANGKKQLGCGIKVGEFAQSALGSSLAKEEASLPDVVRSKVAQQFQNSSQALNSLLKMNVSNDSPSGETFGSGR